MNAITAVARHGQVERPSLLARVRALLPRADGWRAQAVIRVADLTIEPDTGAVRLAGRRIKLPGQQFAPLHTLVERPTRVYGKRERLREL